MAGVISHAPGRATPDISFIVAAHNASPWIERALVSALGQTGVDVEVVVADDGSKDDTNMIVTRLGAVDPRVRLLARDASGGPAAARNLALSHATGDWVAILDADDLVDPGRSRTLIDAAMKADAQISVDNAMRFLDEDPSVEWPLIAFADSDRPAPISLHDYLLADTRADGEQNIGYLKPIFSRAFLTRHAIAYDEGLRIGEDFDICLRSLAAGACLVLVPDAMYHYRVVGGSLSRTLRPEDIQQMIDAQDRALRDAKLSEQERMAADKRRGMLVDLLAYLNFKHAKRQNEWASLFQGVLQPRLWRAMSRLGLGALARKRRRDPKRLARASVRQ